MDFDNGCQHEAFSRTEEANSLQFSLTMEVLLSNNLKISSICLKAGSDNQYIFQSLEAMMYGGRKWLQTSRKLMLLSD